MLAHVTAFLTSVMFIFSVAVTVFLVKQDVKTLSIVGFNLFCWLVVLITAAVMHSGG